MSKKNFARLQKNLFKTERKVFTYQTVKFTKKGSNESLKI